MSGEPLATGPFRFHHPVAVRFRDLDPMGHAHHALPLIVFEEARAAYWREVAGRAALDDIDYIMAEFTVRYHGRIRWPGGLRVGVRTAALGRTSFTMEYEACGEDGALVASGRSVQVLYDYGRGAALPIDAELRRRLEGFEAGA
jgi:acyl-CoA thioester hydrolase